MSRSSAYAEIISAVHVLIDKHTELEPTVTAYMILRAAALEVRAMRGAENAAELCYSIGDEMVSSR